YLVVLARELHAAAAGAPSRAAENADGIEEVREVDVAKVFAHSSLPAAAEAVEPVGGRPEILPGAVAAEAVVRGALVLVAQGLVGLRDLLELLLGVRFLGDVRVIFAREAAIGFLDVLVARAALDAEDLVIALVLHAPLYEGARRKLKSAGGAALAQRIRHQPDERDVRTARLAHAIVRRVQAFEGGLPLFIRKLGEKPGEGAALLEGEVVVVHGVKRYTNPPGASNPVGVGEGIILP